MSDWTDERVDLLKKWWGHGLSAKQIACELGGPGWWPTRNMIIGKVHRLGLPGRATVKSKPQPKPLRPVRNAPFSPPAEDPIAATDIDYASDAYIPVAQRKTIFELTNTTCRWPVGAPGEPEFFFCGASPVDGRPYCRFHCGRAFVPLGRARQVYIPQRRH